MVPEAAFFSEDIRLVKDSMAPPLVRKSYKLSIRSRILKNRDSWSKMALFRKLFFKIRITQCSKALAKTPITL